MQDLFRIVEILDSILAAQDYAEETRNQLEAVLKEIDEKEKELYNSYLQGQRLHDEIKY